MSKILHFYIRMLKKYPTLSPMIQTSFLLGTGDVISQVFIEKKASKDFNYIRTVHFAGLGLVLVGPMVTVWYRLLAKHIGEKGGKKEALTKVVLDQLVFAPTFLPLFISTLGFIEGKNFEQVKQGIKDTYFDILITNYKIWPFVQIVNFYVLPTQYQVIFVQSVAIFWNTYLSWKTHKKFIES